MRACRYEQGRHRGAGAHSLSFFRLNDAAASEKSTAELMPVLTAGLPFGGGKCTRMPPRLSRFLLATDRMIEDDIAPVR